MTDAELEKAERGDASLTARFPNMLPDLEKILGEALSCILETEMKIAFGNLWMEVISFVILLDTSSIKRFKCPWYFNGISTCAKPNS